MSFILDPILLTIIGYIIAKIEKKHIKSENREKFRKITKTLTLITFWTIAGALYLDIINMPLLGAYGKGNHFMWNSGIEIIGAKPIINTETPTYKNPLNPLNILATIMFTLYPIWLNLGTKLGTKTTKNKTTPK